MHFESSDPMFSDEDLLAVIREQDPEVIELWDTQVSDKGVQYLKLASRLREVTLQGQQFTDKAMRSLSSCHSLASICVFCSSQISDKGFLELSNLNLLALSVQNAAITGKTLARSINRWDSMWSLSLDETHIDDRYIEDLFRLPKLTLFSASMTNLDFHLLERCGENRLELLYLDGTRIDSESVSRIVARFPRLRNLFLANTQVSDTSIAEIAKLQALESLRVSGSRISDQGLMNLIGHQAIQAIEARNCGISKVLFDSLKTSCPRLTRLSTARYENSAHDP